MTCKSPTHKAYSDALETVDIAAGLIARNLTDARSITDPAQRTVAILSAMDESAERIAYAKMILDRCTRQVDLHFDRGCANLAPQGIVKGESYHLVISGVEFDGKVTSITPDTIRIKITHKSPYGRTSYSVMPVSPHQITSAQPIR